MSEPAAILRKMLRPATGAAAPAAMSEARAWRVSLPRASEEAIGLVAAVSGIETELSDLDGVLGALDEFALVMGLAGPGAGRGLMMLDGAARAALVEAQTTGRIGRAPPPDRRATEADAALVGHVVDAWLAGFAAAAGETGLAGWRTDRLIPGARAAKMAVDDGEYRIRDLALGFGDGARTGRLRLVTPYAAGALPGQRPEPDGRSVLLSVEAELHAVLHRTRVPLGWLRGLQPGALLEIPPEALGRVRVEDADGRLVAEARLGRSQGMRAIRLADPGAGAGGGESAGAGQGRGPAVSPPAGSELPPPTALPAAEDGTADPPGADDPRPMADLPALPDRG